MMTLADRVATRWIRLSDEEADPSKGGVPARWQEWLDATHQGGRKKVPNPNAETQGRYKEVSFSTALKDKKVFQKALKEYREWAKKHPEKDKPAQKPQKSEESDKGSPKKRTNLPDAVPKAEIKRIFGTEDIGVEDFEDMFASGEGHKTTIKKIRHRKEGSDLYDKDDVLIDSIEVEFEIRDDKGKVVGHGLRNFNSSDGSPVVFHQEIKLDPASQGKGIGKTILKNSLNDYLKRGIKKVVLEADWIGKYTWARMGWDADAKTLTQTKKDFRKHLLHEVGISAKEADKVLDAVKTMRDLSSVRVDGEHAGKDFLTSKSALSYTGTLNVDEEDPGFKTAKEYLGL